MARDPSSALDRSSCRIGFLPSSQTLARVCNLKGLGMDRATSLGNMRALDARTNHSKPAKRNGNSKLSEETKKLIGQDLAEATKSIREIAKLRGVNKATVLKAKEEMLYAPLPDDPGDTESMDFRTRQLKRPKLCASCRRKSIFTPCVQCAAQQEANRSQVPNP